MGVRFIKPHVVSSQPRGATWIQLEPGGEGGSKWTCGCWFAGGMCGVEGVKFAELSRSGRMEEIAWVYMKKVELNGAYSD